MSVVKQWFFILALVGLTGMLVACGGSPQPAAPAPAEAEQNTQTETSTEASTCCGPH